MERKLVCPLCWRGMWVFFFLFLFFFFDSSGGGDDGSWNDAVSG